MREQSKNSKIYKFFSMIIVLLIAPLSQALTFPSLSNSTEETFLSNIRYSGHYLNIDEEKLSLDQIKSRSSEWYLERYGSYYRIKNRATGEYLHTESGAVKAGDAPSGWWSSHWIIEKYNDYVRIRNRWRTNHYIHAENGKLTSGTISSSWTSARWRLRAEPSTVMLSGSTSSFPSASGTTPTTVVYTGLPDCTPPEPTPEPEPTTQEQVVLSGLTSNFPTTSGLDDSNFTRISNCWLPYSKVDIEDGELGMQDQYDTAASWEIEKYGDYYRIKNRVSGGYLHNENGVLEVGEVLSGWWSAQWDIQVYAGYVKIRNRWKSNHYIHANDGYLYSGPISSSWDSAKWKIKTPLPTVDTKPVVDTSSGTPYGANCTWNSQPSFGTGSYNTTYYEYTPIGACQHSLKKVTTTNGVSQIVYQ